MFYTGSLIYVLTFITFAYTNRWYFQLYYIEFPDDVLVGPKQIGDIIKVAGLR